MAASKLATYETGYDDERFEQIVSQTLHCIICTNVIKDPVMCRHNEHLFCRGCITRHLMNSQSCPTCMEPLTVDTLTKPSRNITNLLTELRIRCEFFNRGCEKFVELGNLERHVGECGFAPVVCTNHGCGVEINKQDLLHHTTTVCEKRRVECHSCQDIRQEMDIVKLNLAKMNEKLDRNEKTFSEKLERNETGNKTEFENVRAMLQNLVAKVDLVQEPLIKLEEGYRRLEADNVEMKRSLNEMTKQQEKKTEEESFGVDDERLRKGVAEAGGVNRETAVFIAGGFGLNSVEMFNLSNGTWTQLRPMRRHRVGAVSVVYNNQVFVVGGWRERSIEILPINAARDESSIAWEIIPAVLPKPLAGHCCVVHNGRLIVIGGVVTNASSASITEVSLVSPYASKQVATMPQSRCYHGVALFGDKIVILGGGEDLSNNSILSSVLMYDITKNEFQEQAPMPYPVSRMATVKWGDDNIIIIGGAGREGQRLNKVFMYNIKTQKSHTLPEMKYKRSGCVAVVVRDTVIVMGGNDERGDTLKSVEGFRFDSYSWEDLPEMHEARCWATAVVG